MDPHVPEGPSAAAQMVGLPLHPLVELTDVMRNPTGCNVTALYSTSAFLNLFTPK